MIWPIPLDHYHVEEPSSIPSPEPTGSPAVYAVSQPRRLPQSQELGLHLRNSRRALRSRNGLSCQRSCHAADVVGITLPPDSHDNSGATAGGLFAICRAFSAPERNDLLAHAIRRYLNLARHFSLQIQGEINAWLVCCR
jgi:hypothetical protein